MILAYLQQVRVTYSGSDLTPDRGRDLLHEVIRLDSRGPDVFKMALAADPAEAVKKVRLQLINYFAKKSVVYDVKYLEFRIGIAEVGEDGLIPEKFSRYTESGSDWLPVWDRS